MFYLGFCVCISYCSAGQTATVRLIKPYLINYLVLGDQPRRYARPHPSPCRELTGAAQAARRSIGGRVGDPSTPKTGVEGS